MAEDRVKFTAIIDVETARAIQALQAYRQSFERANHETKQGQRATADAATQVGGFAGVVDKAGASLTAYATSAISVTAALMSLKGAYREVTQAADETLRKHRELLDATASLEQLAMIVAQMRGDVSRAGISQAQQDILSISEQYAIPLRQAERALFFGESALGRGTPAGLAAGRTVAMMAGAARLEPEEVKQIPKLYQILDATTEQKQLEVLNMLNRAAGVSIAELGEMTQPFISSVVSLTERGIPYDEALAYMVAAIQTSGSPAEAATMMERLVDISAGRTEAGLEYLSEQYAKAYPGGDFRRLTDRERLAFTKELYLRKKAEGPGAMDELKTSLDVRGFAALRALYSDAGLRLFEQAMSEIPASATSGELETMYGEYMSTLTARMIRDETQAMAAAARAGQEYAASGILETQTERLMRHYKADRPYGESLFNWLAGGTRRIMRIQFLKLQLEAAYQMAQTPEERHRIQSLYQQLFEKTITSDPAFAKQVYEATGGYGALQAYGAEPSPLEVTSTYAEPSRIPPLGTEDWPTRPWVTPAHMRTERGAINNYYLGYTVFSGNGSMTPDSANHLPE